MTFYNEFLTMKMKSYGKVTKEAFVDLEKILSGNTIETLQGYYAEETKDFSMKKQIIILITIIVSLLFLVIIGIILFIYF